MATIAAPGIPSSFKRRFFISPTAQGQPATLPSPAVITLTSDPSQGQIVPDGTGLGAFLVPNSGATAAVEADVLAAGLTDHWIQPIQEPPPVIDALNSAFEDAIPQ